MLPAVKVPRVNAYVPTSAPGSRPSAPLTVSPSASPDVVNVNAGSASPACFDWFASGVIVTVLSVMSALSVGCVNV